MPRHYVVHAWLVAVSVVVTGCGGGGDGGDSVVLAANAGPTTVVAGTYVSPDGETPMGSALVYVEGGKTRDGLAPQAVACGTPPDASSPATCTAADGSFSFEVALPDGEATLVLKSNGFEQRTRLVNDRPATLALGRVVMDRDQAGSRIAVVFGDDAMQQPLARLGLGETNPARQLTYGSETFKLYDNEDEQGTTQSRRNYSSWERLFADEDGNGLADIHDYAVVLFNSGHYEQLRANAAYREALRAWVRDGGRLVTNGLSYLLVEDLWPTYLDWDEAETAAEEPERPLFVPSESYDRTVYGLPDVALRGWLSATRCTRYLVEYESGSCFDVPAENLFAVDADLTLLLPNSYARLLGPHPQSTGSVRTLVQGNLLIDDQVFATHPLAVVLSYGAGRIAYSAFRFTPDAAIPEGITPHERVLQYLVFAM